MVARAAQAVHAKAGRDAGATEFVILLFMSNVHIEQKVVRERGLLLKTLVLSIVVVATNVVGNYTLEVGMKHVGVTESWSPWPYVRAFAHPYVAIGVAFLLAWMISRLFLLSWADLSYVLPITASSYALSAVAGAVFLNEKVSTRSWAGIGVITLGVALVALTPPETTVVEEE